MYMTVVRPVTQLDRIRNERIREAPKVREIAKKFRRGGGTGKYCHTMEREEHYVRRRTMEM